MAFFIAREVVKLLMYNKKLSKVLMIKKDQPNAEREHIVGSLAEIAN